MLATALIVLVGCFFGFAGFALAESMGWITLEKSWTANLRPRRLLPVIAIVAAANGIMWGVMSLQASQARNDLVATYCHIGSVSAAQESGCEGHVTAREIEGMNTPAALQAQDEVQEADCANLDSRSRDVLRF